MKPEFFKSFNLEHAKAGAPFSSHDGVPVKVLCWDRKHPTHPIILIEEIGEYEAVALRADGTTEFGNGLTVNRLVMLPLGMIDGKPVFVGDEFEHLGPKGWEKFSAHPVNRAFTNNRWPEPEKDYPKSTMSADEMAEIWNPEPTHELGHMALANAVLRHAIDNHQVYTSEDFIKHDEKLARAERALLSAGFIDHGGQEWKPGIGEKPAYIRDAERDMEIAKAVRTAALIAHPIARGYEASEDRNELWSRIREIDLEAIIHSIK